MREKIIDLLDKVHHTNMGKTYQERLCSIADHLIANGVTIPVRCKDCKHFTEGRNKAYNGHFCERMAEFIQPDDFCSYGERKDNDST